MIESEVLRDLAKRHGTPLFVYSTAVINDRVDQLKAIQMPYGFTPLFAAKANPHKSVIAAMNQKGMWFDASSSYEAQYLIDEGVDSTRISLSSQQPAHNLSTLISAGINYVATSKLQLQQFLDNEHAGKTVGLRVNPGLGAGHNNRTTTGGANSSFGLWHSYVDDALQLAASKGAVIDRLHVHIGSGADPHMWGQVMATCLELVDTMPDVTTLDIGGGFKIHRYGDEHEADMAQIAQVFADQLQDFADRTRRKIHCQIEPGTWLVAHAGVLLTSIVDIVDTGPDGHTFLRTDTGMNDIIRPSMYGAQHRMAVLNDSPAKSDYVVVGHNCETGDILTPAPSDPEGLEPRALNSANIGDVLAIYDTGAYCGPGFAATGYNSYPSAAQVFVD